MSCRKIRYSTRTATVDDHADGHCPEMLQSPPWMANSAPTGKLAARQGLVFWEAWISGVIRHYPGEPKPSYITPWDGIPVWKQENARRFMITYDWANI